MAEVLQTSSETSSTIPSSLDHSQQITDSFLYLTTDNPLQDEFSDVDDVASIENDTSLLMDLVHQIDEGKLQSEQAIESLESDSKFNGAKASIFHSHSTPLSSFRHKTPRRIPQTTNDDNSIQEEEDESSYKAKSGSLRVNEAEKLFKLYQPLVNEELRTYISRLVSNGTKRGVKLPGIDESEEEGTIDNFKEGKSDNDDIMSMSAIQLHPGPELDINEQRTSPNTNTPRPNPITTQSKFESFRSPDTTPPNSQEYTNEQYNSKLNITRIDENELPNREAGLPESNSSIPISNSDSDSDFDASYVPKSVKSKLSSPEFEDVNTLKLQIRNLNSRQIEIEEHYKSELSQLRQRLNSLTEQKDKEFEHLKNQNMDLKIANGNLEVKLMREENKTILDKITPNGFDKDSESNDNIDNDLQHKFDKLNQEHEKLKIRLNNSKRYASELRNELEFSRSVNINGQCPIEDQVPKSDNSDTFISSSNESLESSDNSSRTALLEKIEQLQAQIGDEKKLITKDTVSLRFQPHYIKYDLDNVDRLSKTELSNMLKNIMLTLLLGGVDTLPVSITKLGKVLKISSLFMDKIHGIVYEDIDGVGYRPSSYIRAPHQDDDIVMLESCLRTVVDRIEVGMHIE